MERLASTKSKLVAILIPAVMLSTPFCGYAQDIKNEETNDCRGPFKNAKRPSTTELSLILDEHKRWLESDFEKGTQANFCEANLQEVDLNGANLQKANFYRAQLENANLMGADLSEANLQEANLGRANLQRTDLSMADLRNAGLIQADLTEANLTEANLKKAILTSAKLKEADLSEAALQNADLAQADLRSADLLKANLHGADIRFAKLEAANLHATDLSGARVEQIDFDNVDFDLKPGTIPYLPDFSHVTNLSKISYHRTPHTLVELRQAFKRAGMRQQEREITYAIEHTKRKRAWQNSLLIKQIEAGFKYVMFEVTSLYGMDPNRPFLILILLIGLFSVPYMIVVGVRGNEESKMMKLGWSWKQIQLTLKRKKKEAGIWAIWSSDSLASTGEAKLTYVTPSFLFPSLQNKIPRKTIRKTLLRIACTVLIGLHFSLISAFHFGWKDLNVGSWIARIQPRDFQLRGTRWVRTLSGIQSLVSVYLLALWALSYFARPFE